MPRADRHRARLGREPVSIDEDALNAIALYSNGDARSLNLLELRLAAVPSTISAAT